MGLIQYIQQKKQRARDIENLSILELAIKRANYTTQHAVEYFEKYMSKQPDALMLLERYFDMRRQYAKAYYENELFYRVVHNDKNTLDIYNQIDSLVSQAAQERDTRYEYFPIEIRALEDVYQLMSKVVDVKRATSSLLGHLLFPHIHNPIIWEYYKNAVVRIKNQPNLNLQQYTILEETLPTAINMINSVNENMSDLDKVFDRYLQQYNLCLQHYPLDIKKHEFIAKYESPVKESREFKTITIAKNPEQYIDKEAQLAASVLADVVKLKKTNTSSIN